MEQSEAKDERQLEPDEPASNDDTEVEVEIKGEKLKEEAVETDREAQADIEEAGESEAPEAVAEPPSVEEQLRDKEDQYLRLAAEFENYRKRSARQVATAIQSVQAEMMTQLLTIQDNFERALQVDAESSDFADFKKGVELIFAQLTEVLKRNGVEPFESTGEKFDPNYHEALMTVETDEVEEGTVIEELAKGYKFGDRILRHSKVAVAQAKK